MSTAIPVSIATETQWHAMYCGAFVALGISNIDSASLLSNLTKTTDEAVEAIQMLKNGREGDRVYPAVEFLRKKRGVV